MTMTMELTTWDHKVEVIVMVIITKHINRCQPQAIFVTLIVEEALANLQIITFLITTFRAKCRLI